MVEKLQSKGSKKEGVTFCNITDFIDRLPGLKTDLEKAAWSRALAEHIEKNFNPAKL